MNDKLTLCFFIDALGWQVLERHPRFLRDYFPCRTPLGSILGYSSACDPSIISGKLPQEHLHWSSYYWDPENSPFKRWRILRYLTPSFADRGRVRHYLSRLVKKAHGFTGYFQLYSVPFKWLPYFDYGEKWRIWQGGGLNRGESIFDHFEKEGIAYYAGDLDSEEEQFAHVQKLISSGNLSFAYLLFGKLDALMHAEGTKGKAVTALLKKYEEKIGSLIEQARAHYREVDLLLFSDHGMHDVEELVDLQKVVKDRPFTFGKDYAAFYDSTMARFWFFSSEAEKGIIQALNGVEQGDWLTDEQLEAYGCFFPGRQYGDAIFLLKPGNLIVPSFMGKKGVKGMHGYEPNDPGSLAVLMRNKPIPSDMKRIEEIYGLMIASSLSGSSSAS